jgi:hypothetical protein
MLKKRTALWHKNSTMNNRMYGARENKRNYYLREEI